MFFARYSGSWAILVVVGSVAVVIVVVAVVALVGAVAVKQDSNLYYNMLSNA